MQDKKLQVQDEAEQQLQFDNENLSKRVEALGAELEEQKLLAIEQLEQKGKDLQGQMEKFMQQNKDEVDRLNKEKLAVELQLSEKNIGYEELLKKFGDKERDYSMLSDSLYRMKKEKEAKETEDEQYISKLENDVKHQQS